MSILENQEYTNSMKILITGGHLTPALAVIQQVQKNTQIVYVGRKHALEGDTAVSLEYQTIVNLGISFIEFHPGRVQRQFTRHTLSSLGRMPKGVWDAFRILKKEKPDVILSFGGYVAFPFAIAGSLLHVPLVTHEQTLEAGATNQLIAKFASKVCISFPTSEKFFPAKKTVLTGNPLIQSIPSEETKKLIAEVKTKYPLLVITGGSLGSHAINGLIESILAKLLAKYNVIHQTGDAQEYKDFEKLETVRNGLPFSFQERYIPMKFIAPDDSAYIYEHADLVVSRAGINTVLTLLLANIPSLLIPLPASQRQEQLKNAQFLKDAGLGEVLSQDTLTSDALLDSIHKMMEKKKTYINRDIQVMEKLHQNAARAILDVVYATQKHHL